jgi:hypothetical protein
VPPQKDAKKLADRVNAVGDGWLAEKVMTGGHGGQAIEVRRHGRFVSRISLHASVPGLALIRAEAELRRAGCPLPRARTPKKEERMPKLTEVEFAANPELKSKIKALLTTRTREQLVTEALVLIEEGAEAGACTPLITTGDKTPRDLATMSLRRLLDQNMGWKQVNIDRWTYVADRLLDAPGVNGDAPVGSSPHTLTKTSVGSYPEAAAKKAVEPTPEPTLLEKVVASSPVEEDVDMLQAAEDMLRAAEADRDAAQKLADERLAALLDAEAENTRLREQLAAPAPATAGDVEGLRAAYFQALIENVAKSDPDVLLDRLDRLVGIGGVGE